MIKKFYITTPIYYVNDVPHIGHTYTTVAADILSRYYRTLGYKTYFLTGTDEHGSKIFETAKKHNSSPEEYVNKIATEFKNEWEKLNIKYDRFIRTTEHLHEKTVQKLLSKLYEKGDIYKSYYEGLYCIQCEKFLSKDDLVNNLCPDHGIEPINYKEENYFFSLSKYKEKIIKYIESDEIKILPATRKNEILGKLYSGLEDISISRKTLKWGIPLPFDTSQTAYVWIDALINYLSGIDYFNLDSFHEGELSSFWPCDLHLIGKDILWFHSVIWPGLLLAVDIPLPKKIFAHGFFTVEGQKMSKTIGNVIRPEEIIKIFGVDPSRLLLISMFPFGIDGDFSISAMKEKYNKELADNFGNLISRSFTVLKKFFNNRLTVVKPSNLCKEKIFSTVDEYVTNIDNIELHKVVDTVLSLSTFANKYIQEKAPWNLAKYNQIEKLVQVVSDLLYCIKATSLLFLPIMPNVVYEISQLFNEKEYLQEDFVSLIQNKEIKIRTESFSVHKILFRKLT